MIGTTDFQLITKLFSLRSRSSSAPPMGNVGGGGRGLFNTSGSSSASFGDFPRRVGRTRTDDPQIAARGQSSPQVPLMEFQVGRQAGCPRTRPPRTGPHWQPVATAPEGTAPVGPPWSGATFVTLCGIDAANLNRLVHRRAPPAPPQFIFEQMLHRTVLQFEQKTRSQTGHEWKRCTITGRVCFVTNRTDVQAGNITQGDLCTLSYTLWLGDLSMCLPPSPTMALSGVGGQ